MQLAVRDAPQSKALVRICVDQRKSFIFAGQDTTSTLIQWLWYEMSQASHHERHASYLHRLREEHNTVFGPGLFSALDKFSVELASAMSSKLPFTTAFIKEALRLHPPGSTGRMVPWHSTSTSLALPDGDVSIAGLQIYVCHYLIHRDPRIWGPDAHILNPDRWLDETYISELSPGAYRPFECGPRNCIGQELAMLYVTVVLCAIARAFEFEKVGLTGRVNAEGQLERELWDVHAITMVPVDGMVMRVFSTRHKREGYVAH